MVTNPITGDVKSRLNSECPLSAATVPLPDILDLAFKYLSALEGRLASSIGFDWNEAGGSGLNFAYHDGRYHTGRGSLFFVAASTIALTANATNYVYLDPSDNTVKKSTTTPGTGLLRLWRVATGASSFAPEDVHDERAFGCLLSNSNLPASVLADEVADVLNYPEISVGAESSNAIDVTIQVKNVKGDDVAAVRVLEVWLADALNGWETATGPDTSVGVQTGVAMDVPTAGKRLRLMTNSSGTAVIRITESSTAAWYMGVKLQDVIAYSDEIEFL